MALSWAITDTGNTVTVVRTVDAVVTTFVLDKQWVKVSLYSTDIMLFQYSNSNKILYYEIYIDWNDVTIPVVLSGVALVAAVQAILDATAIIPASGGFTIDQTTPNGTYGTLAGAVDGVNTIFTVSMGSYTSGSLLLFWQGQGQAQPVSFAELNPAAGTVQVVTAPLAGDIMTAVYSVGVAVFTASDYSIVSVNFAASPYTAIPITGITYYQVDCTGGNVIINFPTAVGSSALWGVKKIDSSSNTVTLTPNGAETIDGSATKTIRFQHTEIDIYSNSTNLFIK